MIVDNRTAGVLVRVGSPVGDGTNNEAEYQALLAGLRHCLRLGFWNVAIESDSLLVVKQVTGQWKVKDHRLKRLHAEATILLGLLGEYRVRHVRREENADADKLSREICFEQPDIGPPPPFGTIPRKFHFWQAAAVRFWWQQGCRSSYLLARIFGVDHTAIEQIADGKSYRKADFAMHPAVQAAKREEAITDNSPLGPYLRQQNCPDCHGTGRDNVPYGEPCDTCTGGER